MSPTLFLGDRMRRAAGLLIFCLVLTLGAQNTAAPNATAAVVMTGFHDSAREVELERRFLAVPDPQRAREHLRFLTSAPHLAGTVEDLKTAEYVAQRFREAGLDTEIRPFKVWMNMPGELSVDVIAPNRPVVHGPTREHVDGDAYQNDARVGVPFNAYSPSGDVVADVVYANYGRPEDIRALQEMHVDVRGKILLVRYGENYRGVKSFVAQQYGAAGVLMYSDPVDDGFYRGEVYPHGPWRPATAVERGSIQYGFEYSGDPTTPGFASDPELPDSKRVAPERANDMPRVPTAPISAHDAAPILRAMAGSQTPREWQGALPFTYHVGPGPVRVHLRITQQYGYVTIWDVIGRIRGTRWPEQMVLAGNHRDAWVFGAADPGSGTAAMLETVRGVGALLKTGWRPERTIVFASWDAEEQGLIGSTEWAEQNEAELAHAVAYFNIDIGASGPDFHAAASGTLRDFVRDVTRSVPSPRGGTIYDAWSGSDRAEVRRASTQHAPQPAVDNLGAGSDYTPFIQHLGIPSTDIRSIGPYGVYHSAFDNFAWFTHFADPTFEYTRAMARVLGLEVLRMAQADVLPYDYEQYGREIESYVESLRSPAERMLGEGSPELDAAMQAARRLSRSGARAMSGQRVAGMASPFNENLVAAERALLLRGGLPGRAWYRHIIYAPGQFSGYSAEALPGVSAALEHGNAQLARQQLVALAAALNRAAELLEAAPENPIFLARNHR
jgi:N-acetylated-alpha-linked acidic dipeptidase